MIRARYGKFTRVANEFSLRHPSAVLSSPSLQINLDATLRATSSVTDCAALYRFARSSPVHLWRKTHDARIPRSNVSSNGEQRARLINGPRYAFAYTRIRLRTAMVIKREREGDTLAVLTRSLFLLSNRTCDRRNPRRTRDKKNFVLHFFFLLYAINR